MVYFRVFKYLAYTLPILLQVLLFSSCKSQEDFHYDGDGTDTDPTENYGDTIKLLRQHTEGEGFPIVIMADGYTASDISNGTYRKMVLKTDTALFSMEPMASLKQYFDIIEVAVPSKESGIGTTKKNTAFKTYCSSGNSTEIYGDSVTVFLWLAKALAYEYNITDETTFYRKMNRCQGIVLLNSSAYKGITLLSCDTTVTDSIPLGYAFSYIPDKASYTYTTTNNIKVNRNVFTDLVQHEAVGHGIGKLADEYFYPSTTPPTNDDILIFKKMQKYGFMMNAAYDPIAANDELAGYYVYDNNNTIRIDKHSFYTTDMAYSLEQDPRYANDDIKWYQGCYEFLTYKNSTDPRYYICEKNFYRPSLYSTMNATTDTKNKLFNAVSRLAIYKRVKRAALGTSFTCDLHKAADLEAFANFDEKGREASIEAYQKVLESQNKNVSGAKGACAPSDYIQVNEAPTLSAPKIISFPKININDKLTVY